MKKALLVPMFLLLFVACTPQPEPELPTGGNLPYRAWASWEEMKEVLGDHYLYPTYLPDIAGLKERPVRTSWYRDIDTTLDADELFYGYSVMYWGDRKDDRIYISATDGERRGVRYPPWPGRYAPFEDLLHEGERFNENTVTVGGIAVSFFSAYGALPPPDWTTDPDWHAYRPHNARIVNYTFTIGAVTYEMSWVQFNVEDGHDDSEQQAEMLRVATSIIKQVREVEQV